MRIAVMSDLHDNIPAWDLILRELSIENISTLINCGDTVTVSTLRRMAANFNGVIHTVFGNNADRDVEWRHHEDHPNVVHHGVQGGLTLEGIRLGFVHFPEVAEVMARSGEFDVVCHGHTHLKRCERRKDCLLVNPGTAGGVFQYPSFATIDLPELKVRFLDLRM